MPRARHRRRRASLALAGKSVVIAVVLWIGAGRHREGMADLGAGHAGVAAGVIAAIVIKWRSLRLLFGLAASFCFSSTSLARLAASGPRLAPLHSALGGSRLRGAVAGAGLANLQRRRIGISSSQQHPCLRPIALAQRRANVALRAWREMTRRTRFSSSSPSAAAMANAAGKSSSFTACSASAKVDRRCFSGLGRRVRDRVRYHGLRDSGG